MYLVDTNVLLEVLLEQEQADQAAAFLTTTDPSALYLTDFSLYSLGIILHYRKRGTEFERVIRDVDAAKLQLVRLSLSQLTTLENTAMQF